MLSINLPLLTIKKLYGKIYLSAYAVVNDAGIYNYVLRCDFASKNVKFHKYFIIILNLLKTDRLNWLQQITFGDCMKVLIVDDEEMIRGVLKEYVEFEGGTAFEAADGMQAVRLCKDNDFDIILMDVMMPRLDGFSAVKEIKKIKNIPVIMLSARGEEYDKLFGFEIGADDYVTKPFSPKEVMARIHAVLKRTSQESVNDVVTFEGLTIDIAGRNVYVDGEKAELTPKEYEILFYFVKNKGIALTREKLLMDVWGFDFYGDDRTVDTHIKMLRSNLKQYRKFIVTLRGLGYKFEV